jgi:hypothetical protein
MASGAGSFTKGWVIANSLALLIGYLLYTPIAHGLGGDHPQGMSPFQIFTHAIALAVVAVTVVAAQRQVLAPHLAVPWTRFPLAAVLFALAFFAGSYQPWLGGPDWDILFGSLVLGSAAFVGLAPMRPKPVAAAVAVLAFPIGCFIGQLIILGVVVAAMERIPDLQTSRMAHSVYWVCVGVAIGLIGGAIGGPALWRLLAAGRPTAAAS